MLSNSDNWCRWIIEVHGAPGTLYEGETFHLQVDFAEHYPMEAPLVRTRSWWTVYLLLSNDWLVIFLLDLWQAGPKINFFFLPSCSATWVLHCCWLSKVFVEGSKLMGNAPFTVLMQVIFMQIPPLHPHIYSNGHICLGKLIWHPDGVFFCYHTIFHCSCKQRLLMYYMTRINYFWKPRIFLLASHLFSVT